MGIGEQLGKLSDLSPLGHFLALRVGFAFPIFEQNTLPRKWVDQYAARGLVLHDPVMHWMFEHSGVTRWSEIRHEDPRNVLSQAKLYGINYGVAICCVDESERSQRSFGSFVRADREFDDHEIAELQACLFTLHQQMIPPTNLTRAELEALSMVKNGLLMKEIADFLGVSEGAVKQRLKNAKTKLKAKTSTHAATMATTFGLI